MWKNTDPRDRKQSKNTETEITLKTASNIKNLWSCHDTLLQHCEDILGLCLAEQLDNLSSTFGSDKVLKITSYSETLSCTGTKSKKKSS